MNAVVLLAPGFEELEAVTIVDVLRRAGLSTLLAGIAPPHIEGGHGIKVVPDSGMGHRLSAVPRDSTLMCGGST